MGGGQNASVDLGRLIAYRKLGRSWVWNHAVNRIVVLQILTTGHLADDISETWGKHGNYAMYCQYSLRLKFERMFLQYSRIAATSRNVIDAGLPGMFFTQINLDVERQFLPALPWQLRSGECLQLILRGQNLAESIT